jgi:hypothetical protein
VASLLKLAFFSLQMVQQTVRGMVLFFTFSSNRDTNQEYPMQHNDTQTSRDIDHGHLKKWSSVQPLALWWNGLILPCMVTWPSTLPTTSSPLKTK